MNLRARDLAWLAAVVETCPRKYARKKNVVDVLQHAWKQARESKTTKINIPVLTRHGEDEAKKRLEAQEEKGRKH